MLMKKIICFVPIVIGIVLLVAFTAQRESKIIFLGDSITEAGVKAGGYITRIDSMCRIENKTNQYEFVGAGMGGNKIYDLYLRLENDVLEKILILFLFISGLITCGINPRTAQERTLINLRSFTRRLLIS